MRLAGVGHRVPVPPGQERSYRGREAPSEVMLRSFAWRLSEARKSSVVTLVIVTRTRGVTCHILEVQAAFA